MSSRRRSSDRAERTTSSRRSSRSGGSWSEKPSACARSTGTGRSSTPVFEDTALFERTSGAGSDVVQKEMYTFEDRGGRSLTLRPEGTAPICRAYVEHGMHREPQPVKLYTVGPMYRYAAPQRGRYREHWQLSVEAIGSEHPSLDAEIIQLYHALLARLGRRPSSTLAAQLDRVSANAGPPTSSACDVARSESRTARRGDAREGRGEPAARVRQSRREAARGAGGAARGARIGESLCEACREHFAAVRRDLDACGVSY